MTRRPATLADVARAARVSIATVSRVLTLPEKVSRATRARVQQAIDALGYVANGSARALASRRSRTVGALIPTLDNPSFASTVHALQKELDRAGYTLLLACHEFDPAAETRLARTLIERGVDGLVLLGGEHDAELYRLLARFAVPYVLTWALDESGVHPCVGFDNRRAAERMTEYLLDLGHTEIGMISGITANNERARDRVRGVRQALEHRGLRLRPEWLVERPYTLQSGREAIGAVLAARPRPTAVICGNDVLAIGAAAECHARGIAVPKEVSISGFDDMEIARLFSPPLTTVHFPTEELGEIAARRVRSAIEGEPLPPAQEELPVRLVVRATTAPPARSAARVTIRT